MASFRAALFQLAAMQVTGVRNNYDLDALPERLQTAQLPALLVLPIELQEQRFFREWRDSLGISAFRGGIKQTNYAVTHLLSLSPRESGLGIRSHLPQLIALIDNYMAVLALDSSLGGKLRLPAEVSVEPGIFAYGEREFYGCAFRHRWTLEAGA
ncbi:MAG: hypothetical protein OXG92_14140 [Chloroflexi bacterium]|nr:hypothetical protein [Chloroflexota bacterium]MCY3583753.1 hypothetical protein [Chloroflexota bacterium]MCY3717588.1 hypothetical protein [Chloroflexota bacterium]MDE2651000.1 hypothetical protein [Chloroflexota bacterium]MXV94089.1 hypothetical protein [Chloroflexota bacterium]